MSDCTYLNEFKTEPPNPVIKPVKKGKINPTKYLTEVRGIEVYTSTIVTRRGSKSQVGGGKRKEVLNLSADSLARLAFVAFNTPAVFASMMTLTYPAEFTNNGDKVKQNLNALLVWYRRNFGDQLYLWWLEFQKRGAPHFHVLSTVDLAQLGRLAAIHRENGETWLTHWDTWQMLEKAWQGLGGGMTAWEVVNDPEGGKKYAAKYATKAYQKAVPPEYRNVGRFWGHSRQGVKPEPDGFYECSEIQLREALKRGGWEHLPDDGARLYPELFQAAQAIDLSLLKPSEKFPEVKYPKPERNNVYICQRCGHRQGKWEGQCPMCFEGHGLILETPQDEPKLLQPNKVFIYKPL